MWWTKLKTVAAVILSVAVSAGAGGLAYRGLATEPPARGGKKAERPKDDAEAILGRWKVVSVEMDGKKDPEGQDFDILRMFKVTFTKDKQITEVGGGSKESAYKLDPRQKPKAIDMEGDVSVMGVYALEGDTLKLCFPNAGKGGGDRPTAVATKEGDGMLLLVLKREAKDRSKDK
jgi:uncharacterized protein (TIGR03067 family)